MIMRVSTGLLCACNAACLPLSEQFEALATRQISPPATSLFASWVRLHRISARRGVWSPVSLQMGLYDSPLPPRPPPRKRPGNNENGSSDKEHDDDDDDDDDLFEEDCAFNLFKFNVSGKEVKGLLPNLTRRLDSGVACYFEPTDRLVQNLVGKTSCSIEDACWALEACKGDITEAWTRISMARRMLLEDNRHDDQSFDADVLELEVEDEFLELKEKRIAAQKKKDIKDLIKGGEPDEPWLPRQSKGPVDDEPWFTG